MDYDKLINKSCDNSDIYLVNMRQKTVADKMVSRCENTDD